MCPVKDPETFTRRPVRTITQTSNTLVIHLHRLCHRPPMLTRLHYIVLTIIDRFSKAGRLVPHKGLPTAMETAMQLFTHVWRNFGIPEDIISDQGPQFISRLWTEFCRRLDVNVSLTSGCHPQSNGQVERLNQELGCYLRSYRSREQARSCVGQSMLKTC